MDVLYIYIYIGMYHIYISGFIAFVFVFFSIDILLFNIHVHILDALIKNYVNIYCVSINN